jgi:hypothetical protein
MVTEASRASQQTASAGRPRGWRPKSVAGLLFRRQLWWAFVLTLRLAQPRPNRVLQPILGRQKDHGSRRTFTAPGCQDIAEWRINRVVDAAPCLYVIDTGPFGGRLILEDGSALPTNMLGGFKACSKIASRGPYYFRGSKVGKLATRIAATAMTCTP